MPYSDGRRSSGATRIGTGGYWLIGSDGGVFAFGDAGFAGSLPGLGVNAADGLDLDGLAQD